MDDSVRSIFSSFEFVHQDVPLDPILHELVAPADGAVGLFVGVVRGDSRGRQVLRLEYEAYEPMARQAMDAIFRQTAERFPVRAMRVLHRLGTVPVSGTAVVVAVASAHRAAAFDAARHVMECIKADVPIWKREVYRDGSAWVTPRP